jgi:hypothetical protein
MSTTSKVMECYIPIWFKASIINALISSFIILLSMHQLDGTVILIFILTYIFSLALSIPVLIVAMMIAVFIVSMHIWDNIFHIVLSVTFIVSITGVFFYKDFLRFAEDSPILLGLSIVISAVTAVLLSREKLNAISAAGHEPLI